MDTQFKRNSKFLKVNLQAFITVYIHLVIMSACFHDQQDSYIAVQKGIANVQQQKPFASDSYVQSTDLSCIGTVFRTLEKKAAVPPVLVIHGYCVHTCNLVLVGRIICGKLIRKGE